MLNISKNSNRKYNIVEENGKLYEISKTLIDINSLKIKLEDLKRKKEEAIAHVNSIYDHRIETIEKQLNQ